MGGVKPRSEELDPPSIREPKPPEKSRTHNISQSKDETNRKRSASRLESDSPEDNHEYAAFTPVTKKKNKKKKKRSTGSSPSLKKTEQDASSKPKLDSDSESDTIHTDDVFCSDYQQQLNAARTENETDSPQLSDFAVIYEAGDKGTSLAKMNTLAIQKSFKNKSLKISNMRLLRRGDLLVKTEDKDTYEALLSINELAGIKVRATLPKAGNITKGIIRDIHPDITQAELVEEFSNNSSGAEIDFVKRLGDPNSSTTVLVAFKCKKVPSYVFLGFIRYPVKEYEESPIQCYKCLKWGHSSGQCTGKQHCLHCGENTHSYKECDNKKRDLPTKCANCGGDHAANAKTCPARKVSVEILKVRKEKMLTTKEARNIVLPKGLSYAEALRRRENPERFNLTTFAHSTVRNSSPPSCSATNASFIFSKEQLSMLFKLMFICMKSDLSIDGAPRLARLIYKTFGLDYSIDEVCDLFEFNRNEQLY